MRAANCATIWTTAALPARPSDRGAAANADHGPPASRPRTDRGRRGRPTRASRPGAWPPRTAPRARIVRRSGPPSGFGSLNVPGAMTNSAAPKATAVTRSGTTQITPTTKVARTSAGAGSAAVKQDGLGDRGQSDGQPDEQQRHGDDRDAVPRPEPRGEGVGAEEGQLGDGRRGRDADDQGQPADGHHPGERARQPQARAVGDARRRLRRCGQPAMHRSGPASGPRRGRGRGT